MHGIVQRNFVTRVKGNEESTYRQGNVNLTPADLGAVNKDFSIYSIASTPYTGSELIPMRAGSDNVYTSINALASQIGGGSGSEQTALVNYKKIISSVGGNGSFSQPFQDSNITGDMVLLEAHLDDPSVQTSDWTVTCSDSNGGQVIISGSANGTTAATLYFGVGMSTTPTILTNLESNSADNLLKTAPRPGVTGTLGSLNGGTGVSASTSSGLLDELGAVKTSDIVNNLTSTATDKPLAAAQGKVLNDNLTKKAYIAFNHYSIGQLNAGQEKTYKIEFSKSVSYNDCMMSGCVGAETPFALSFYPLSNTAWKVIVKNIGSNPDGGTLYVSLLSKVEDIALTISSES